MLRKDVQALMIKTDPELAGLVLLTTHQLENLTGQRDDSLKRIEAANKAHDDEKKKHQEDCDDLRQEATELRRQLDEANTIISTWAGSTEQGKKWLKQKQLEALKVEIHQRQQELDDLSKSNGNGR